MTSQIKSIINENVLGKTVLVRADLNIPISNGEILDQSRCLLYTSDAADE